jgi:hypothetical protein
MARLGRAAAAEQPPPAVPAVPDIVRSFARRAVADGPVPRTVHLRQCAEIRLKLGDPWRPLTAEQVISVHEPAFIWLARMPVRPFLYARILDCYLGGEGFLEVRLLDSLRLARASGPLVGKGELMRYLAELAWAPHAMLHNPHLSWRQIDATSVEVTAESAAGPARVRLDFENGDVAHIAADDRPRAVGNRTVPTRWEGRFLDYREMGPCRVPTRATVSWLLEDGPFETWRGRIASFELG